jgi:hypothetical protein
MAKRRTKASRHGVLSTNVATRTAAFVELPLEIRETIYRMLLTTPWTYTETLRGKITESGNQQPLAKTTEPVSSGRFNFSLAILRVNKQIHGEATRILFAGNELIIVKIRPNYPQGVRLVKSYLENLELGTLEFFNDVPAFRKLSEAKVTNPVLTVTISTTSEKVQILRNENWVTLIITPEVMPRLFDALWDYGEENDFYKDHFLALDLRNRNPSRQSFLNEHIVKIWDQLCGFGEVRLTGDIGAALTNYLTKPLALFPYEDEMVRYMEIFHSRAENFYRRNDFAAAYFHWYHLQRYWVYHFRLEEFTHPRSSNLATYNRPPETRLSNALNVTAYKLAVSALGIVKILLRLRNYTLAVRIAQSPGEWLNKNNVPEWNARSYKCIGPVLLAKFSFCCALARIAQGQNLVGKNSITQGVLRLLQHSNLHAQRTLQDIFDEVCKSIDNELIQRESRWRCTREDKVVPKSRGGNDWQLHVGCPSFWDWLEIPEDEPGPEFWAEPGP